MRIGVAAHTGTRVGGVETYLATAIPALVEAGHDVACWFETAGAGREPILTRGNGIPTYTAADGSDEAVHGLRSWRPDVLYMHGLASVGHERALMALAPAVLFAHSYYGTCISGTKMQQVPASRGCTRMFGSACLVQYYPRRCGGWSPRTMMRMYGLQRARLELLGGYSRILVASEHMADEYGRHGLDSHVQVVPLPIASSPSASVPPRPSSTREPSASWRLLYLGRLESRKGAPIALGAAGRVAATGRRPVHLQMSGEGSMRAALEAHAARLMARCSNLRITFTGWLDEQQTDDALGCSDLLLVPSCWPEPFGMVGVEAAARGVPAVAFAVGGIPEWLSDGVTGRLVPGDPPDESAFAHAIAACLADDDVLVRMREQCRSAADRFRVSTHVASLQQVFGEVVSTAPGRRLS